MKRFTGSCLFNLFGYHRIINTAGEILSGNDLLRCRVVILFDIVVNALFKCLDVSVVYLLVYLLIFGIDT